MEKPQVTAILGGTSSNPDTEGEDAEYAEQTVAVVLEDGEGDNEVEQEEEEDEESEAVALETLPVQFQKVGRFGYCHCWCYL